jgi:5'-nucleotidase (lipoprotein e(P4) family)
MTRFFAQDLAAISVLAALAGCTPAATTPPVTTTTPVNVMRNGASLPTDPVAPQQIHWYRNSAEMRGIYLEVYHLAAEKLDNLAASVAPGTWGVILDADETMIDNSTQQKEQGTSPYSDSAWRVWVNRKAAPALPGVVEFTRLVHRLGGRVISVSNRENLLCDATRENLKNDSIDVDLLLCRTTTGDKNPRFDSVAAGTASPSLPPLKILMFFGDNIQDFPKSTQALRDGPDSGYSNFGKTWFLLPNPMYGSWERVPYR